MKIVYFYYIGVLAMGIVLSCIQPLKARDLITKVPPNEGIAKYNEPSLMIIGGKSVPAGDLKYDSIVRINTNGAGCTASVVGPQVIITAAHCAKTGATASFKVKGVSYTAKMTRSSIYPGKDHDICIGKVDKPLDVPFEQVTEVEAKLSDPIVMYGYGCINAGGGGGNDGVLRFGSSEIISFSGYDYVAKKAGGAALCFGDSGGPSFHVIDGKLRQSGVNSKGNISDTSYFARLDLSDSQAFMKKWASDNQVDICGVTLDCDAGPAPEKIEINSDKVGKLIMTLKPDGLDPDYVKRHMEMLMMYLEQPEPTPKKKKEPFCPGNDCY